MHEMGVTLQLWENGDRKGRSILINLPLIKAPRNIMPIRFHRGYELYSVESTEIPEFKLVSLGTDPSSAKVPIFMSQAINALQIREYKSEKQWPDGINKDLILESSLCNLFISQIMKHTWFTLANNAAEMTLSKQVDQLKQNVGISPIYNSVFMVQDSSGVKYKPVAKKVVPVSMQDLDAAILVYKDIQIEELSDLSVVPKQMEELKFTKRLMKERLSSIISKIPAGFLTKSEAKLLIHILFQYE